MSFTELVRNRKISWPTQFKFNIDAWIDSAVTAGNGDDDLRLAMSGLWIADALGEIRSELSSPLWSCGFERIGRALIGEVNRTVIVLREQLGRRIKEHDGALGKSDFSIRYSPAEGVPGVDLETQVEVAVDNLDRALAYVKNQCDRSKGAETTSFKIEELMRVWGQLGAYSQIERLFHEFAWGVSNLSYNVSFDAWHIIPRDPREAIVWSASMERLEAHVQETMVRTTLLWKNNARFRRTWQRRTGGIPLFSCIKSDSDRYIVKYKRRKAVPPDAPPMSELFIWLALDMISDEDFRAQRKNGFSLHDAMMVFDTLALIGKQLVAMHQDARATNEATMSRFAPALDRASLIVAIAEATGLSHDVVANVLSALTWQSGSGPGALWNTPLIPFQLDGWPVLCPVLTPIVYPNMNKVVDYWITELGLSLAERGTAFERQAAARLIRAVDKKFASHVLVWHPKRITSSDDTYEEVDLLIRLGDRFVLAELKCNKFPDNPTAQGNFLSDLRDGASQALRKTVWLQQRAVEFREQFKGLELAVEIVPIVLSNQSLGVGLQFQGVPVVDLTLLEWYLGRPYLSIGRSSIHSGKATEIRHPPLYTDALGLGREFTNFIKSLPPLFQYLETLRLEDVPFFNRLLLGKPIIRCLAVDARGPTVYGSNRLS